MVIKIKSMLRPTYRRKLPHKREGAHIASLERELMVGVWGGAPAGPIFCRVPGQAVSGKPAKPMKAEAEKAFVFHNHKCK